MELVKPYSILQLLFLQSNEGIIGFPFLLIIKTRIPFNMKQCYQRKKFKNTNSIIITCSSTLLSLLQILKFPKIIE